MKRKAGPPKQPRPLYVLDETVTHENFASLVGVQHSNITNFVRIGALRPGGTLREWLLDYCARLRRTGSNQELPALTEARTRFEMERTKALEIKNKVAEREFAPVSFLSTVLAGAANKANAVFDGIPGAIRLRMPELPAEALKIIEGEVTRARAIVSSMSLDDALEDERDSDGDDTGSDGED